jgi:hypothetical protein
MNNSNMVTVLGIPLKEQKMGTMNNIYGVAAGQKTFCTRHEFKKRVI